MSSTYNFMCGQESVVSYLQIFAVSADRVRVGLSNCSSSVRIFSHLSVFGATVLCMFYSIIFYFFLGHIAAVFFLLD
jgi:hypothetical protein